MVIEPSHDQYLSHNLPPSHDQYKMVEMVDGEISNQQEKEEEEEEKGRGKYKCGRCGQPKVNHVCLFEEEVYQNDDQFHQFFKSVKTTSTQVRERENENEMR